MDHISSQQQSNAHIPTKDIHYRAASQSPHHHTSPHPQLNTIRDIDTTRDSDAIYKHGKTNPNRGPQRTLQEILNCREHCANQLGETIPKNNLLPTLQEPPHLQHQITTIKKRRHDCWNSTLCQQLEKAQEVPTRDNSLAQLHTQTNPQHIEATYQTE